jgi:hypothetical protein
VPVKRQKTGILPKFIHGLMNRHRLEHCLGRCGEGDGLPVYRFVRKMQMLPEWTLEWVGVKCLR